MGGPAGVGTEQTSVLSRVVAIVEAFGPGEPVLSVSEIARRTGLHVATASRLVEALTAHGWLHREPDRRVSVGIRLWEVASRASPTLSLREAALPFMEDVHASLRHHVQLGVREGAEVLFVERLSAPEAVVNITRIAGRLPLHASSSGLVLLAHAPAPLQEEVLAAPLAPYSAATVVDPGRLRALLAQVRRTGEAYCPGFIDEGVAGIAVPVRGPGGDVVAALSAVLPDDGGARAAAAALRAAAHGVTRVLTG